DYLSKPFVMSELLARVRVQARRVAPTAQPEETIGRLTYSPSLRSVRISESDEPIKLTKKELAVFECLLARKGMLVSKSTLANHLYGDEADIEEAVVEIYISRLRKQLEGMAIEIKTARGLGYLMTPAG
ncbi:MAG: response regulator transcription factor, partial [Burkholderiaceae bacterium]